MDSLGISGLASENEAISNQILTKFYNALTSKSVVEPNPETTIVESFMLYANWLRVSFS